MKRVLVAVTILAAAFLAGCPIYSDTGDYRVCDNTTCYDCPDTSISDACILWQCNSSADCGAGYDCNLATNACFLTGSAPAPVDASAPTPTNTCKTPAGCGTGSVCGADLICHPGDCVAFGCPVGYACWLRGGPPPQCVPCADAAAAPSLGYDAQVDAASADASFSSDAATDAPSADGDSGPVAIVPCNDDSTCGGVGARCLNGQCTAQAALCADSTQCAAGSNEVCVDGVCTAQCDTSTPCPIGFGCDLTRHVCNLNPTPCTATEQCTGGTICVEAHCVAPCLTSDAGDGAAYCPPNELCVNGGCVPNEGATFICKNEGFSGTSANQCDPGSVCLHGSCYPACDAPLDGGGCATGTCTEVVSGLNTFAVCLASSPLPLGGQCNPQTGLSCASAGVCIDGNCE
jgi:hypothetical protein